MGTLITRPRATHMAVIVLTFASACSVANAAPAVTPAQIAEARDYVFAACLIDKYPGSALAAETEIWAGGLVERGTLGGTVYPELAQLAHTLAPAVQTTQSGQAMLMQSCVTLYNSPALRKKLVRLLAR